MVKSGLEDRCLDSKTLYFQWPQIVLVHEILYCDHHWTYKKGINFWGVYQELNVWSLAKDQVTSFGCAQGCAIAAFFNLCVYQLIYIVHRSCSHIFISQSSNVYLSASYSYILWDTSISNLFILTKYNTIQAFYKW